RPRRRDHSANIHRPRRLARPHPPGNPHLATGRHLSRTPDPLVRHGERKPAILDGPRQSRRRLFRSRRYSLFRTRIPAGRPIRPRRSRFLASPLQFLLPNRPPHTGPKRQTNRPLAQESGMKYIITIVLLLTTWANADVFHVAQNAPNASDHNPGTAARPWLTL